MASNNTPMEFEEIPGASCISWEQIVPTDVAISETRPWQTISPLMGQVLYESESKRLYDDGGSLARMLVIQPSCIQ